MREIILKKRYPHSREEDITDAFMRGYEKGKADRPQGKWIYTNNPLRLDDEWACNRCGNISFVKTNFCDRCGARMKGADDGRNAD